MTKGLASWKAKEPQNGTGAGHKEAAAPAPAVALPAPPPPAPALLAPPALAPALPAPPALGPALPAPPAVAPALPAPSALPADLAPLEGPVSGSARSPALLKVLHGSSPNGDKNAAQKEAAVTAPVPGSWLASVSGPADASNALPEVRQHSRLHRASSAAQSQVAASALVSAPALSPSAVAKDDTGSIPDSGKSAAQSEAATPEATQALPMAAVPRSAPAWSPSATYKHVSMTDYHLCMLHPCTVQHVQGGCVTMAA